MVAVLALGAERDVKRSGIAEVILDHEVLQLQFEVRSQCLILLIVLEVEDVSSRTGRLKELKVRLRILEPSHLPLLLGLLNQLFN